MTVIEDVKDGVHLGEAVIRNGEQGIPTKELVEALTDISQIPPDAMEGTDQNFERLIKEGKGSRILPGQKLNPPTIS